MAFYNLVLRNSATCDNIWHGRERYQLILHGAMYIITIYVGTNLGILYSYVATVQYYFLTKQMHHFIKYCHLSILLALNFYFVQ